MAHFLIDASLPRPVAGLVVSAGHHATDVRDIGLAHADDKTIAELARKENMCLLTRDQDFGNIKDYPPQDYSGIVVFCPPDRAGRLVVLRMIHAFLLNHAVIDNLPGCLVIVDPARIRVRPA
jgi:predicted nuclease of predicted toxin-antitoxin system